MGFLLGSPCLGKLPFRFGVYDFLELGVRILDKQERGIQAQVAMEG